MEELAPEQRRIANASRAEVAAVPTIILTVSNGHGSPSCNGTDESSVHRSRRDDERGRCEFSCEIGVEFDRNRPSGYASQRYSLCSADDRTGG
ncbi:hypothetical protein C480_07332 [Natrialba aegyptia DSM 13077]|uniref:Uncharacterized protein n=1 Tax=Natrialba aegyptia DSM 13077 TaxID=1227491 RepID=M0BAY3_9EURY|nr:hypothetical protein C480_07332 [Natrialba aegyptia DSM 13077]